MRIQHIFLFLVLTGFIWNCTPKKADRSEAVATPPPVQKTDKVSENIDTVIHSVPESYVEILDTISPTQKFDYGSYKEVLGLFEKYNYTPESWKAGIREVPRLYITKISEKWDSVAEEVTVQDKKRIFFRALAPVVLRANELILKDRKKLNRLHSEFVAGKSISNPDSVWILKLAELYKSDTKSNELTKELFDELIIKVDMIPPSLALSQGAEESGWGTSRFAELGNAIFGQWTWGAGAIVPKEQRKNLGNYGIKAFDSPLASVCAYMLNLNTQVSYSGFRNKRAELRKTGDKLSGAVLAKQLTKYSERGEAYVTSLEGLMSANQLAPTDDAYLSDDPPIYLIPKE